MPATLTIKDESLSGVVEHSFTLEFPSERITVGELIRARVYQEVDDYNRNARTGTGVFRGLVQPSDAEVALNGFKPRTARELDWKAQFESACEAYRRGRVLVLVGDRQTSSLEDEFEVGRGAEVSFLRLVPLVGG